MQTIKFHKYHGTGNDFIMIDAFHENVALTEEKIQEMCHRRFGIGADGLIILRKHEGVDFFMDFYNSDGKPGSMCGNGGRCIVAFAHDLGIVSKNTRFVAPDGPHEAIFYGSDKISLKMNPVKAIETHQKGLFINTGSPHLVVFRNDSSMDVFREGREIRYSEAYKKEGTNVNFVISDTNVSKIFTYERGVEDETYACGTGTVASALALNHTKGLPSPIELKAKGGNLKVYFKKIGAQHYDDIWLEGSAQKTFSGFYSLDSQK
ncbi:MAG TPA: diaminopimelate epimerase [Marinilabiliales bacterium]|jgi:diaminopimelate epimerase|nr:MAG: diaminopimelate epimerase [Bacteroidetes bacterium GWA2_40_14]OFX65714.1 MAG: diaminopimelate epimerase [Bacteroidetes bacterium GWC2_40_13]OFX75969.1 MAG: diaminopimelate epimerase [Bacteroidetes bacterium GWD2_40_43]OFX94417.1 MAG: diaminopimelate epimerase [Bacteroidetes bacterium GWE2_40_63]OFY18895.1 MAG: diaminopimelate epimerase [Bacteroidetes bacterium GWF2_40_13]OFZ28880.1 MAG: diaminopimelate epimerase [Bacteroidetes bacterium RIFOXYC2_FULL_40_12]HAM99486.1 diaminopimelate e